MLLRLCLVKSTMYPFLPQEEKVATLNKLKVSQQGKTYQDGT